KEALDGLRLTSFAKTSGSRGMHVFVPIRRGPDADDVLAFARKFCERLAAAYPRELTVEHSIEARGERVYLDPFRNAFGQTVVTPFCVRRRPKAPVSTPLDWSEVTPKLDPAKFNVGNFGERLRRADPWADFFRARQSIHAAASSLSTPYRRDRRTRRGCPFLFPGDFLDGLLRGVGGRLLFDVVREGEPQISRIGRITQARLQLDGSGANELFDFAIKVLHTFLGTIVHGIEQALAFHFTLFHIFASAHGGLQDFQSGYASFAVAARQQALRNDKPKSLGEAIANGLLIGKRKYAHDALDRLRSIDGVQRGKNQVAGFGRLHRDFDRFTIAHFAHQDNLGRLPQGRAQSQREGRRIAVEFALMNGGFLVLMAKLDGVLDAEDVNGP